MNGERFVDLFCGIGGFRIALEKENGECVFSSDIDDNIQDVYEANFGEKPEGDITKIHEKDIPEHEILCAGFPCQSFSVAGKRKGLNDKRGQLFYDIIRIASYHQPDIILLENVITILSIDNGNVLDEIVNRLQNINYRILYFILNSSLYGIPQTRKRTYFVCLNHNAKLKYMMPKPTWQLCTLADVLIDNQECQHLICERNDIQFIRDHVEHTLAPVRIGYYGNGSQGQRIYSVNGHAISISASCGGHGASTGLYLVRDVVRKLHITEVKRLMGFDDNYQVTPGRRGYQQLGNAVIPRIINNIYKGIKEGKRGTEPHHT